MEFAVSVSAAFLIIFSYVIKNYDTLLILVKTGCGKTIENNNTYFEVRIMLVFFCLL